MANKIYLDAEGLTRLKQYMDDNFQNILKPSNGIVIADDGSVSIASEYTDSVLAQSNAAANRASQSAIVAGNYAAQAIQARQAIEGKIWYGTMEEYNALDSVSSSTIYIILHE